MTGSITYLVDCASYQGAPDWARVAATCGGGAEKVTEGTSYVNPRWGPAKPVMRALGNHGFVPLAYMFLDATATGAAQASHFAAVAGDLAGFGIVVDGERAPDGSPTMQQARDAVGQLRRSYPGHPVGGYFPHWYTGGEDLSFVDWLWASEYVSGSGDPGILYSRVPAAWWAPYGGKAPLLLQFTPSAAVAGISGPVDCSAFHGTPAQLAALVLRAVPPPVYVRTPVLRPGSAGSAVRYAQVRLNLWGAHPPLVTDGRFGPVTTAAVRAFQTAQHLGVDGVIGPQTWAALLKAPPGK